MNPYVTLASTIGTREASSLCHRLTAWHDAMVTHERRLRTTSRSELCEDDCPHAEARTLWREALAVFGAGAHQLSFLRSQGSSVPRFQGSKVLKFQSSKAIQ
jgi:hypothetical protein